MTEAQLQLAWRLVDEPILCFDGDGAGQRAALRAALRALPLLAPGKSLRIATLPPGEDPDDLVKRGGAAAFEAVLAMAIPLIDLLWRSETEGIEATTPERRAAVRQRLRAHADSIADASIKALYAADFSARFDALYLARPDRPRRNFVPGARYQAPLAGASAALRARAGSAGSGEIGAVLAGLIVHPLLADHHGESLSAPPIVDPRQSELRDAILAALALAPGLETMALTHNLAIQGFGDIAQVAITGNTLRFSFTRAETPLAIASRDLGMMVDTIAARARIEAELALATTRLRSSLDEVDFRQQQLLLAERVEIDAAMMRLAESLRDD